tara:strand:+ start:13935 stop:16622 length:2688 start_codon:yes stop_codon:yes gene_type:complete
MKVAVKKRVLFNLLKNRLNENRMQGGDMAGRLIHPFNIQSPNSDPFGFYEDDEETPIKVSDHMSVQLSVPKMPVEDEDFVPSTITELCNAATLICKEVPLTQIEYYYRQLHMLLDRALDRESDQGLNMVNESFEISRNTTIKDFTMISESSRIRVRQRKNTPTEALPAELQPEDLPGFAEATNKDEYMRGYNFAADFEVEGKSEDELYEHDIYVAAQSDDFKAGYSAGDEVATGIQYDVSAERPLFPTRAGEEKRGVGIPLFDSYEQFLARGTELDPVTGDVDTSAYDNATPQEKAAMDASAALQEVFKEIHSEATAIMMDPKMAREFGALMTPITQEMGLGSTDILTPLNVGRMFSYVNRMKDQTKKLQKIQDLQMKMFTVISEALDKTLKRKPRIRKAIQGYASEANVPLDQFMLKLKEDITNSYTQYGSTSRVAAQGGDAAVVNSAIDKLFAVFIKTLKLPGTDNKFKDRSHFYRNVDLNSLEEILDGFKAVIDNQLKDKTNPDLYVVRDRDVTVGLTEEEIMGTVETYINLEFEQAESTQTGDPTSEETQDTIDLENETTDEVSEIEADDYLTALERYGKRYAQGKNVEFQDMAPFFGYSNTSGMRQYYLKDILTKLQMLAFTDTDGQPSSVGDLQDENAVLIVNKMVEVVQTNLIPEYEKKVNKGQTKPRNIDKKNKVKEVGTTEILAALKEQILPSLELLQKLFAQGYKFTEIAADENHVAYDALQLVGGSVFREVQDAPISNALSKMLKKRNELIADEIIARVGQGKVNRTDITDKGGIAEYFTGLKGLPDFDADPTSKKGKIVGKLINIGITAEVFAEVLVETDIIWNEVILDELQYEGGEYRDEIVAGYKSLVDDEKLMKKTILSGIKAIAQEKHYMNLEKQPGRK